MSKKPKPEFQGPPSQSKSLQMFTPQGFYSPTGSLVYNTGTPNEMGGATGGGYQATLNDQYNPLNILPQYDDIRLRLLGDIGLTGSARADQLDQYGQAFMDKSLEYSAPRLKALTYGRGQAGSRMAGDAYADLINKASTDSVLSREQLRNLDEQLKLQQLQQVEGGIGNAYNQYATMINQLLNGGQISQTAANLALEQANQYVASQNMLESERYQRALQSHQEQANRWQAGVAIAAAPFTGGASLAMMPKGSVGGGFNLGGMSQMAGMMGGFGGMGGGAAAPGATWAGGVPGMSNAGMGAMSGANAAFMPKMAF